MTLFEFIKSKENLADSLTKGLVGRLFQDTSRGIGLKVKEMSYLR